MKATIQEELGQYDLVTPSLIMMRNSKLIQDFLLKYTDAKSLYEALPSLAREAFPNFCFSTRFYVTSDSSQALFMSVRIVIHSYTSNSMNLTDMWAGYHHILSAIEQEADLKRGLNNITILPIRPDYQNFKMYLNDRPCNETLCLTISYTQPNSGDINVDNYRD